MKALALAAALVAAALAVPAPAQAASGACVSRAEFRKVHHGQTVARVRHLVGARGRLAGAYSVDAYRSTSLSFRACGGGTVLLDFHTDDYRTAPARLDAKWGFWA